MKTDEGALWQEFLKLIGANPHRSEEVEVDG